MAEKIGEMYTELDARTDKMKAKLQSMKSQSKAAGLQSGRTFATGFNSMLSTIGVGFGVITIVNLLKKSINLAGIQEKAEIKLAAALGKKNDELVRFAAEMQKVTAYGDEEIIQAQAMLAAFTDNEEQLKKLTKATLDFAAAKDYDLKSAADLIGKTFGSTTNALTRYGITVEGAVLSEKRLADITGNIQKLFGGMAEAEAKSFAGRLTQIGNEAGDTAEKLGKELFPAVERLAEGFGSVADAGEDASPIFKLIGTSALVASQAIINVVNAVKIFGTIWVNVAKAIAEAAQLNFTEAFKIMKDNVATAIDNIIDYADQHAKTFNKITDIWKDPVEIKINSNFDFESLQMGPFSIEYLMDPKGFLTNLNKIKDAENDTNKEFLIAQENLINNLKFLSDDYTNYIIKNINKRADHFRKMGLKEIDIEAWKFQQLRELWKDYEDFWNIDAKPSIKPKIEVPDKIEGVPEIELPEMDFDNTILGLQTTVDLMNQLDLQIKSAGYSFASMLSNSVIVFKQANSLLQQYINLLVKAITQAIALAAVQKFITTPVLGLMGLAETGGTFTSKGKVEPKKLQEGGTVSFSGKIGPKKLQVGGSFIVPPGFINDSFPLLVKSGERVTVDTTDQVRRDKMQTKLNSGNDMLMKILIANVQDLVSRTPEDNRSIPIEGELKGSDIYLSNKKINKFIRRAT